MIVLDAHVLLWADRADGKLGRKIKALAARQLGEGGLLTMEQLHAAAKAEADAAAARVGA